MIITWYCLEAYMECDKTFVVLKPAHFLAKY
jgi:hypothetical protein